MPAGAERWAAVLAGPDGDLRVLVESRLSAESATLTCRAVRPGRWRTWHLIALTALSSAEAGTTR